MDKTMSHIKTSTKSALISQVSIIVVVSFGVYFNTLFNSFVYDDFFQIINNPWIRDPQNILKIFSSGAWGFNATETNYYRPIMNIIYMVTYALVKLKPWGYHLVNIVFHAAVSILVFFITSRIMRKAMHDLTGLRAFIPVMTALIFSLHPIHTEVVAWIGGIPDLTFSFFFLLSLYLYILAEKKERSLDPYFFTASIGSFFIATLCKEPAVTLPLIIVAYDLVFHRSRISIPFCFRRYSFYVLILCVYFIMRITALGGFAPVNQHADLTLLQALLNSVPLFVKYMYLLLVPVHLNAWHVFHPVLHIYDLAFILALGLALSFFLFSLRAYRANKLLFFSICLLTIPLLPALYIPGTGENPFAERYLYLPTFGFAILLSLLLGKLSSAVSQGKMIVSVLFLMICVLYSTITFSRNYDWKDDITFWTDTSRKSPDEPLPHYNLGNALERQGRLDEAIQQYKRAIVLKPASVAYKALGHVYSLKGLKNETAKEYMKALELEPGNAELHNETGIILMETGNYDNALDHFMKAVELVPDDAKLRYNYAIALRKNNRTPEAIDQLKIAIKLDPSQTSFRNALKRIAGENKQQQDH